MGHKLWSGSTLRGPVESRDLDLDPIVNQDRNQTDPDQVQDLDP